jgi:hypothetical protein
MSSINQRLPPRSRSHGPLAVVALGLVLTTCGDDKKSTAPLPNGGAGGTASGLGGSYNPFAGQGGSARGGSGPAGSGGGGAGGAVAPDGGGTDLVPGTGNASIKFCNLLVVGDDMGQTADTTVELTVGSTKVTASTFGCAPAAPMPCASVTPGVHRVIMTVIAPPVPTPIIYDQMVTFVAGTAYLALGDYDEMAMTPILRSQTFAPGVSCAAYLPPPSPMKFCNRFFRGGAPVTLDLNVAGLKFTAASGTCTPAVGQACVAVPSGEQMVTLTEGATVLTSEPLIFTPGVSGILHASPVNNLPVLGGLEVRDAATCSMVGYAEVDTFLMTNPPMASPFHPMKVVGAARSRGWDVGKLSSGARPPLR